MDDTPRDSSNDMARPDAPVRDEPRQPAPLDPAHFTMTVDDASARFAEAGLPRSARSIQRYCQRGHLTCTTVDTEIAEMYLIDPDSVERRIHELQQIEFVTRASGVSRHDATRRDTQRQEVASDKIEDYERRIKELEEKAMHLEIDKRAKEQIINMLKDDRETLFVQVSNHVRTITDQARVIGQLETRLELAPGRIVEEQPSPVERTPVREVERPTQSAPPPEPVRSYEPVARVEERREPTPQQAAAVEYPPRYGTFNTPGQGDSRAAA